MAQSLGGCRSQGGFRKDCEKTEMKKDLLIVLAVLAVLTVFLLTTDFQTVDQYYLTHIDDITPDSETVTISIRCDQILQNYHKLDKALQSEEYVPADGLILPKTTYVLREGDTVFNILDRTARYNKIQLEYQGADRNLLGTVYIQGIHYLYEFSCGAGSGWVYSVNGQFPNCGCGEYVLSDGDEIVWYYTCNLGRDVGAIPEGGRE